MVYVGLLLAASCAVSTPQADSGNSLGDQTSPATTSQQEGGSEPDDDGRSSGVSDSKADLGDEDIEVSSDSYIEVLEPADVGLANLVRGLQTFGYQIRPSSPQDQDEADALGQGEAELSVNSFNLGWGIDSTAVLVTVEQGSESIADVAELAANSTSWLHSTDNGLVALYQGGLTAPFEMDTLLETIKWFIDPDSACGVAQLACPYGPDVGFPPPPPVLMTSQMFDYDLPFDQVELGGSSGLGSDGQSLIWVDGGTVFTLNRHSVDDIELAQAQGPGTIGAVFGCLTFAVDGPAIVARSCNGQGVVGTWPIPESWNVVGLAVTGTWGHDNYQLVVSAKVGTSRQATVGVVLPERFIERYLFDGPGPALDTLPALNPDRGPWTLPQRNIVGDLTVVEQRRDGWYLVDDSLTNATDLLRSDYPIVGYTIDTTRQHMVVAIDGPLGEETWWISNKRLAKIAGSAPSVSWAGSHSP